ncbi:hypothetical protein F7731_23550 [Cytobacillus depressus]|uniref:Uncharacterized protein n=1 Tax=Cytobacillus depressus TaxID=1602942 RepID=A0A6L3UXT2_9BACI|nr:hypothetical protein [Cytobacillus depressus]KAB2328932.1 hypothetical protein F7731_23550 [Cytobacillus depressus]
MAQKKTNTKKTSEKSQSTISKIQVVGPTDETNGAQILKFSREGNKNPLTITPGEYLDVGEEGDISQDEAQLLLNYSRWEVREVEDGKVVNVVKAAKEVKD